MIELYLTVVIAVLVLALIGSQVGWMIYSQRLVDKAMSRSFPEYKEAAKPQSMQMIPIQLPREDDGPSNAEILNRQMAGMVSPPF